MKRRSINSIDYVLVETVNDKPYYYFVAMKEDTDFEDLICQYHTDEITGERGWWVNSTKHYPVEKLPKYVQAFMKSHEKTLTYEETTQGYNGEYHWKYYQFK